MYSITCQNRETSHYLGTIGTINCSYSEAIKLILAELDYDENYMIPDVVYDYYICEV